MQIQLFLENIRKEKEMEICFFHLIISCIFHVFNYLTVHQI